MRHYLRTNDLYFAILARINRNPRQVLMAYYDIHTHPRTTKNPAWNVLSQLIAATSTGTDVRLLLPAFKRNPPNRRSARYLETAGFKVRTLPEDMPLHCKMMIFDRDAVIVGSHNISQPAFTKNLETSALLTFADDVRAARDDFYKWWRVARRLQKDV